MESRNFGQTCKGQEVGVYTLKNENGMELEVLSYGATIRALRVPDRDGVRRDVVLGYDTVKDYEVNTCYFGAAIGRNANRIAGAQCRIEGYTYLLEANDNENNLHSGSNGFHNVVWHARYEENETSKITFTYYSKEGDQGYHGNMNAQITYTLTEDNALIIDYQAKTDKVTIANFTNHAYYNLNGHASGSIEDQELEILASYYTPVIDNKAIPTGEIQKVSDTPMDFRVMKRIGQDIDEDFFQLVCSGGYDHNYVLDKADKTMQLAARAKSEESGIEMSVYTDCAGIQFYSGNFVSDHIAKEGVQYSRRQGFCLETQYFPNAINDENFESPILKPDETYRSQTKMCFGV